MFFFLSKFLPLFCYPLGLSCGLMVVAAVVLGRRPRLARGCLGLAVGILWVSSTPWAVDRVVGSLEQQYQDYGNGQRLPQADAIVVLGGATYSGQQFPRQEPEVSEAGDRLLQGLRLYQAGKAPWIVLSGGRVQWQLQGEPSTQSSAAQLVASEAEDMAYLLQQMGLPPQVLVLEKTSLNTYQNAVNTGAIARERGWDSILLVTSALHMPRALATFRKLGLTVTPAPTDFLVDRVNLGFSWKEAILNVLPDADNQSKVTRGLKEWLGLAVYGWRGWL